MADLAAIGQVRASVQRLARRAPWQAFAPVMSLALAGLGVVLLVAVRLPAIGTALGAVIAAAVSVFAAYISYRLKQDDDARIAERDRIVEQMGVAEALIAEIEDNKRAAEAVHSYETIADIWKKMSDDGAFIPFLVEDAGGAQVYEAVIGRLLLLPYAVVRPVVRYYAADNTLNESIAAWRSADFRALCDPKDAASVAAGRPRQKRFVMWTLLSICDVYRVDLPDLRTRPGPADPELAALLRDHLAAREGWFAVYGEGGWPFADSGMEALRGFAEDCRAALDFLEAEIRGG